MKSSLVLISTLILFTALFSSAIAKKANPLNHGIKEPQLLSTYSNNTRLNIHMAPHTHDDIGWMKTIDQYYYGDRRDLDVGGGVQYILDNVVNELSRDSRKKFIYVEMGFFKRWWQEQEEDTQNLVKQLIAKGQFEFINGGYCMNDEAAVYYEDSIDQMTIGHQFLMENFNYIPEIGWHIDPFGHASAQAALFAQMGFKAFFFGRIDYQDKAQRLNNSGMEMIWVPQTSQGNENAIFTAVNYYLYMHPPGFNFDMYSNDKPIGFDPNLEDYDLPQRADQFVAWFRQMSQSYRSSDLFHTLGEDFAFQDGHMDFKNYDRLMKYINSQPQYNVNVFYSTPNTYIDTVNAQNITYPFKYDDFFPYADVPTGYWTGYFTSRTSIKGATRKLGRFTQAVRKLASQALWQNISPFTSNNFPQIDQAFTLLEEAMGNGQHHDAVTGTEKQAVAEDYKLYFAKGENAVKQAFLYPFFQEQAQKDLGLNNLQFNTCELNVSTVYCNVTYNNLLNLKDVLVGIYNPAQARNSTVRIKVPNGRVQAFDQNLTKIDTDVLCTNKTDSTDCDLFFTASFPAYGKSYFWLKNSILSNEVKPQQITYGQEYPINQLQSISPLAGLQKFTIKACKAQQIQDCYSTTFSLAYNYYKAYQNTNPTSAPGFNAYNQNSGAYIFKPSNDTKSNSVLYTTPSSGSIYIGKNLVQIHIESSNVNTDIRIYNDLTLGLEVNTFVNSIPVADKQGKEIILLVNTPSINNNKTFYTDSMGMEMQKRILNYRPTWNASIDEPVSGNYYPIQSTIYIEDSTTHERLAVLPDRAQGGSSINQGSIELLIHRRLLLDDARGVEENLNELDWDGQGMRQKMTHTLLFTKPGYIDTHYRRVQYTNDQPNLVVLASASAKAVEKTLERSPLQDITLDFVKLFSKPISSTKYLFRFHNMDETQTRNVSTSIFQSSSHGTGKVTEMSLTYNQPKADMIKNRFNWNGLKLNDPSFINTDYLNSGTFALRPLEIRTFIVDVSNKQEEILFI